jgi:malate dehydrogenase (oxaloacetate-decarboxylating)(NADP+)
MALFTREEALYYHSTGKKGKLEVIPIKPCANQKYLSMAYSPGVAEACREIVKDPLNSFEYTGRGNLVAVISNGSAVLGLGNIGPLAGKPVMEGKGVLFKTFADIDCYDINLDISDADKLVETVKSLEPTFGGINLEDIKAPECFYIENSLIDLMDIPVFHDDQHGTAIISGAGLINALEIFNKRAEDLKVVIVGAGAAGIACAKFYCSLGVDKKNIYMFDSRGLVHSARDSGMNPYKKEFSQDKDYGPLSEVIKNTDVFLGLSQPNLVTQDMVRSMAENPVIFAMSNPDPEITYPEAKEARPECIMGTGRSDFPNQVNNVSGFPYIFRGALDVRSKTINEEMKLAAAHALADLAKEPVPEEMKQAYGVKELSFGLDYIIPKPLDHRVLEWEAYAVAKAAMQTGVARKQIDLQTYSKQLRQNMKASLNRINKFIDAYNLDI